MNGFCQSSGKSLEVNLLGPPFISHNGRALALPRKKERALLFYLAVCDQGCSRAGLADLIWGDLPEKSALHSLTNAIYRINNHFGYVYQELGDRDRAMHWNSRGLELCRQYPWPEPLGYSLVNLAADYMVREDYTVSLDLFREAEELASRHTEALCGCLFISAFPRKITRKR